MTETEVFKAYDVRGVVTGDDPPLSPKLIRQVGQAFGTYIQRIAKKNTIVLGRDNGQQSYTIAQAVMEGLRASGCRVFDLGLVATPVLIWHAYNRGNAGSVMVTSSHRGSEIGIIKLGVGNVSLYDDQIQLLHKLIEDNLLAYGQGEIIIDQSSYRQYIDDVVQRVPIGKPLHIVVDGGHGTAGLFAPRMFQRLGCTVTCIRCEPTAQFERTDPTDLEQIRQLADTVREKKADVGFVFDIDADRLGVVDETGAYVPSDQLLMLLARDLLQRYPGAVIVGDVLHSNRVFDDIRKHGGRGIVARSGHALVHAEMIDKGGMLAGDYMGYLFIGENYFGYEDTFAAAGRIAGLITRNLGPLSKLTADLPKAHTPPMERLRCPIPMQQTVIDGVRRVISREHSRLTTTDGVRLTMDDAWAVLRPSNTEDALVLRCEGDTPEAAAQIRELFIDALKQFPQVELNSG